MRLRKTLANLILTGSMVLGISNKAAAIPIIETVPIRNLGNAPDTRYGSTGSVPYFYKMGKYEVNAGQYSEFLNAVAKNDTFELYNQSMGNGTPADEFNYSHEILRSGTPGNYSYSAEPGRENQPISFLTFWSALRFCNWLENGQPTGGQDVDTTEDGSYTLNGKGYREAIFRNPGAKFVIPTADEWHKAAYYDPTLQSGKGGYWLYATQSDVSLLPDISSFYGTFNQNGNGYEMSETIYDPSMGSRHIYGTDALTQYYYTLPEQTSSAFEFRIAEVVTPQSIPEPLTATLIGLGIGAAGLATLNRKRR